MGIDENLGFIDLLCDLPLERTLSSNLTTVNAMSTPNQLESLRKDALSLPDGERADLARDLVASLDGPADIDAAQAWDIEICRRINEIEAGNATLLEPNDVIARVKKRVNGS